jgi:hypothetical protein
MTRILPSLVLIQLLAAHLVFGQQSITVVGSVRGSDMLLLSNTHIMDIDSRKGTVSDDLGRFWLSIPDTGTVLRISHVGYHPILHTISKEMIASNEAHSFPLTVRLTQQSTLLSTVDIIPNEHTVLGQRGTVLYDFSFMEEGTLLLLAQDGERRLSLRSDLRVPLVEIPVGKKGEMLYEDCLGNVHLFGKDSVYQITLDSAGIRLAHAFSRVYFIEQMGHCATSSDSHIFFSSFQKAGQEVSHYGLHRTTKEGVLLRQVYDHETLQEIEDHFNEMKMNPYRNRRSRARAGSSFSNDCGGGDGLSGRCRIGFGRNNGGNDYRIGDGVPAYCSGVQTGFRGELQRGGRWQRTSFADMTLDEFYDRMPTRSFELQQSMDGAFNPSPYAKVWMNMLQRPTYSPMFNLRDSIYVFDHVMGICHVHTTDGKAVRTFPIVHQDMGEWRNKLVADANGTKLYARVVRGSSVHLAEIDLDNGAVISSSRLRDAKFAEQLKVKDGHAYYMVQDSDIMVPDRLIRQRL